MVITEGSQIGSSISCICWIAGIYVYFGLTVTKMTTFLLKSHHDVNKFAEETETEPAALMSFSTTQVLLFI